VLEALGNLGDFLGGVGVFITLGYLAIQVRQNTQMLRRGSLENLQDQMSGLNARVQDRNFSEVVVAARGGIAALDDPDQLPLRNWILSLFGYYQRAHEQRNEGTVSADAWPQVLLGLNSTLSNKGCSEAWLEFEHAFPDEFRDFVRPYADEAAANPVAEPS
jgi:hypothetical protein